jgi:hypothetical protein
MQVRAGVPACAGFGAGALAAGRVLPDVWRRLGLPPSTDATVLRAGPHLALGKPGRQRGMQGKSEGRGILPGRSEAYDRFLGAQIGTLIKKRSEVRTRARRLTRPSQIDRTAQDKRGRAGWCTRSMDRRICVLF